MMKMKVKALVYSIISGLILCGCSDNTNESFSYAVKQTINSSENNTEFSLLQNNLIRTLAWADTTVAFKNYFPTDFIGNTSSGKFLNMFYPGWIKAAPQLLEKLYSSDQNVSKNYVFLENCTLDEKFINKERPTHSYILCESEGTKDSRPKLYFRYLNATTIGYDHVKKGLKEMFFCRFDGKVSHHLSFSDCVKFPSLNSEIITFIEEELKSNDSLKQLLKETEQLLTYEEKLACNDPGDCFNLMRKKRYAPFLEAAKKINIAVPTQISEEKLEILCK